MAVKYPHMAPADEAIWDRWLLKHGGEYELFEYDVHVGGVVERQAGWSEETYKMASTLAAKRIDVVAHKGKDVWIIEVKPEGRVTAVGQLVTYNNLYRREMNPPGLVTCMLVCENILQDEQEVLNDLGFEFEIV